MSRRRFALLFDASEAVAGIFCGLIYRWLFNEPPRASLLAISVGFGGIIVGWPLVFVYASASNNITRWRGLMGSLLPIFGGGTLGMSVEHAQSLRNASMIELVLASL